MSSNIKNRHSCRVFREEKIPSELLDTIVKDGSLAPSAGNQQPWSFVIIENLEVIRELKKNSIYTRALDTATAIIIVCQSNENLKYPEYVVQDLSACTQNILLSATSLGISSCWLGVAPISERVDFVKKTLNISDDPFCIIALGYSDSNVASGRNALKIKHIK